MSTFKKVVAVKPSLSSADGLAEKTHWSLFKNLYSSKGVDSVAAVKFDPLTGKELFSLASTRFTVYSTLSMEKLKSASKSADVIKCIAFRCDGKLFALGNSAGGIQIFDSSSKKMVRKLAGHKGPVCGLAFTADKTHLISVSDDKCIKLWDVPTEQELASITAHQDYVKACAISASGKLFVTGSYDHTIKIWDTTNLSLVMEINTSAPVESVLISPNAALIISSGSNSIKFWDISLGGKLLHSMSPHQKTITSLAYSSNFSCILTGALDRHVKVVDLDTYKITQVFKLPGTVMSVACNSSDTAIAFGLGNGVTILRTRNISTTPSSVPRETVKFNFVVSKSSLKLSDFEKALKGFRFRDALDLCLAKGNPELILACCTELIAYDALSIALSGRDEAFVACILKFIGKALTVPEFSHVTLEVLSALLEIYDGKVCCWREFREALSIVLMKLNEELRTAKAIGLVSGQLEMICSANSLATAL